MNENSISAYREGINSGEIKKREQLIFEEYYFGDKTLTDRQVLNGVKPGSDNMNWVSPRITEMLTKGILKNVGDLKVNGRPCRQLRINHLIEEVQQVELF